MNKNFIFFLVAVLFVCVISVGLMQGRLEPEMLVRLSFGFVAFASLFFSRGILIFLTLLCLILGQSYFPALQSAALWLRWVFFGLFCLHIFGDLFLGKTVRGIKSFDLAAVIFIIFAFLSMVYSPFPQLTLERSATVLLLYLSVFWIIWKYAYDYGPERTIRIILLVAWIIYVTGFLMVFVGPYRPFLQARFTGVFYNPNGMGVISALILPLALWQYMETKKRSSLFLFVLILASLMVSGARGSINAAVISLGYLAYVRLGKNKPLFLFFSLSIVFILIWVIETLIKTAFKSYMRIESIPILGGRLEVWPIALNLIMDKPIFGYGFGVEDKLIALNKIVLHKHAGAYMHNSYLGITLQLGILGFILLLVPLFVLLFKELAVKRDNSTPLLRYALRSSLIAGLICCIYESFIYSVGNAQSFPFWMIVMLLVYYRHQAQNKEKFTSDST